MAVKVAINGFGRIGRNVLRERWVLAVAGTHGKTSTSSLLAWILEYAQMAPGFLVGGHAADKKSRLHTGVFE